MDPFRLVKGPPNLRDNPVPAFLWKNLAYSLRKDAVMTDNDDAWTPSRPGTLGRRWPLANRTEQQSGQSMVEYALILIFVALVVILVLLQLGGWAPNVFSDITVGWNHH